MGVGAGSEDRTLRQLREAGNKERAETMKTARLLLLVISLQLLWVSASSAHHSFSAVYDGTKQTTVTGVVNQFRFVNPHAMMYLTANAADGKAEKWVVEFDGRLNLSNFGWTEN